MGREYGDANLGVFAAEAFHASETDDVGQLRVPA